MPINDPVLYYTMNNVDVAGTTITDRGSGGNNGTLINSPTTGVVGKIDQAFSFGPSANQEYISTTSPTVTNLTIAYWINLNSTPSAFDCVISTRFDQTGIKFFSDFRGGSNQSPTFGTYDGSTHWIVANASISVGVWHHIVGTFDGSIYKIYIDGLLDNSATDSTALYAGPLNLTIAAFDGGLGNIIRYLDATLDEVRIYNRALSPSEVTDLYNFTGSSFAAFQSAGIFAW